MKSPWKYLAGLTSFGRTIKEPASPPEAENSKPDEPSFAREEGIPAPLDRSDDGASATVDGPDTSADPTGNLVVPVEIVEQVSAAIRVDSPRADDHASERAQSAQPRKVQRRVRKPSARPVAVVAAMQPKEASVVVRSPPTLSDEVAALDEEVRQLRRQLTEKLRLQNKQLAGLLKRFDRS
ncbi:hypothetical protein [Ensifer sesbaniae]|jgi:hypothetical protein|uniref:hypothetical protein n=2 Tax=Ensifer sesbaniae TaxID=1214071 RepID=UPI001568C2B7|nr:hypothetical protein [Ensifer sesbaniae]NRQ17434.1 hypothetical protein [Ensifer sesbaniae]